MMVKHTSFSILQSNVNHSAGSQDLLLQTMAEWNIDLAVAAEPYYVPPQPHWAGDHNNSVVIITRPGSPPMTVRERGSGYVVVKWRELVVMGTYFSPNKTLAEFEAHLDVLNSAVRRSHPDPVFVLGDLNARSQHWGDICTKPRGTALEEWAVEVGLLFLNEGMVPTCVRHQGSSRVDVSLSSPSIAHKVQQWRVIEDVETLSDHRYIRFEVSTSSGAKEVPCNHPALPRWLLSRLNRDLAEEAAIGQAWCAPATLPAEADEAANWFRRAMTEVCSASMPKARGCPPPRRAVYWWSQEIADLRTTSCASRRAYLRYRRRRHKDPNDEEPLRASYMTDKKALQLAISLAKGKAREDLLVGLDRDPWGRPYRSVRDKVRGSGAPLIGTLRQDFVERVVTELFPDAPEIRLPRMAIADNQPEDAAIPPVSDLEMSVSVDRLKSKRTAPGPDGVHGRVLGIALEHLGDQLRAVFDLSLRSGQFPAIWKCGRLCLIQKEGKPPDTPSAYRPIVLLDEAGKMLERIIVSRLTQHITTVGPNLADEQYGFRPRRSTIDAISALKDYTKGAVEQGDRAMAVSLDIANAFNSLPFEVILEALKFHGVPLYLQRILRGYLQGRHVVYVDKTGALKRWPMRCGVPQGSVLGPMLWNLGYDWVLRGALLPKMRIFCYADDTLVVAREKSYEEVARLASVGTTLVVNRIGRLGLKVALHKTEVVMFHGPRKGPPPRGNNHHRQHPHPSKANNQIPGSSARWPVEI